MRWFGSGCLFLFVSLDRIQILHHLCKYKWMLKLNHADRLQRCAAVLRCYFGLLVTADTYTVLFFQWRATLPPPCCFPSQSCSSNCLTLPAVLFLRRLSALPAPCCLPSQCFSFTSVLLLPPGCMLLQLFCSPSPSSLKSSHSILSQLTIFLFQKTLCYF